MTGSEFLQQLDVLLELPEGTLKGSESLTDLVRWDSMSKLAFIALAETRFKLVVDGAKVGRAGTIGDLLMLLGDALREG